MSGPCSPATRRLKMETNPMALAQSETTTNRLISTTTDPACLNAMTGDQMDLARETATA